MEYHVAKNGRDSNPGTLAFPFLTIQKAADLMNPGDKVLVHEGVYREWVKPRNGGISDSKRIIYEAAPGEKAVIKGSEIIKNWEPIGDGVWKVILPNDFWQGYNPYATPILGDWLVVPYEPLVHTGEVYLNGKAFYEAGSLEEVREAKPKTRGAHNPWSLIEEKIRHPEDTIYRWYAEVTEENTIIYANFHAYDPNVEETEINVRRSAFFPEVTGRNYITVRGFEMAQAASMWAPPTSFQTGLIGPHWSKGWIIENNDIHDARCSAVCLGKEASTGDNDWTRWGRKPGYQNQLEDVFKALAIGWSFETIGSHIVRNNVIHDCGQNGIVGHLGCIGSEICGNEIYNINTMHEYFGWEVGGIKLHAALDVQIHNNYIHDCVLGTWLDWEAQGVRVSCNIYDRNYRDLMVEVSHGPYVVDHNIFTAEYAFENAAQGGDYLHNLCGGFTNRYTVLNRATPYHYPHSTKPLGTAIVYGGDDRVIGNIFAGGRESSLHEKQTYGTEHYEGSTTSLEDYVATVRSLGHGDVEQFEQVKQPAMLRNNVYCGVAKACSSERNPITDDKLTYEVTDDGKEVTLSLTVSQEVAESLFAVTDSTELGETRISEERFENPEGRGLTFNRDFAGADRGEMTCAGPFAGIRAGENHFVIWRRE